MAGKSGSGNKSGRPRPSIFKTTYDTKLYQMLNGAKHRAKVFKKPFDLTFEFVKKMYEDQDGRCLLTGRKFDWSKSPVSRNNPNAPTIDKIEAAMGYTQDNVRLITYHCNIAINQFGLEAFLLLCKDTLSHLNTGG